MENLRKLLYPSEDFVDQILSELPPKSLMRLQCVCNMWCNLIKSRSFVVKHLSSSMRASSMPVLFKRAILKDKSKTITCINDEKEVDDNNDDNVETQTQLSSLHLRNENDDDCLISTLVEDLNVPLPASLKLKHCDLIIACHCDGIICLKLFIGNVILCNPDMKEFKLLPKSFLLLPDEDFDLWSLEYELECYTEYLGFGYDPKGKDYKVVRIVIYDESGYSFKAEVYTMDSNSWREIETQYSAMTSTIHYCYDIPLYLNGICYWHVSGRHMEYYEFIISFDMGNELFHEILIPDLPDGCRVVKLAMWKEFISLLTYQENTGVPQSYDMWVMIDDHGDGKISWEKHLTLGPLECDTCPLLFWKSDHILMVIVIDGHVMLYNIGTQILKYLPIYLMTNACNNDALVYVNSIVSINGGSVLEDIHISAFYGSGKFYSGRGRIVDISSFCGNDVKSAG